jgi:predicted nucleotidyltransferase component of viral defense system
MIPQHAITEWRAFAPWADSFQVEQDLVISRALVQLYSDPYLAETFAFRGGTAMQKLFFDRPTRYSEDIDLVQLRGGAIGPALDAIRKYLDPWLGEPRRSRKQDRFTLVYHYESEVAPVQTMRLKVEVNNGEKFNVLPLQKKLFETKSLWFNGKVEILTYAVEELLGTKLRALYQRKKGRDLYDMAMALKHFPGLDATKVVECCQRYLSHQEASVSRAQFESNLVGKLKDSAFIGDINQLLASDASPFDPAAAGNLVLNKFVALFPGEPWKGDNESKRTKAKGRK